MQIARIRGERPEPCYTPAVMAPLVDTLIFDLDDTLVVEEASARAAFIQTSELARVRHGVNPEELHDVVRKSCRELWYGFASHPYCRRIGISSWEGMWAEFTGTDSELKPLRNWAPEYRVRSWQMALHHFGIDDPGLAAELADAFPRLRRDMHVLYPDSIKALVQCRQRHSLGLLTNGAADLQRRKLEGAGLAGYFDQVLISGEIGIAKPDRRVFEMLLTRMKSRPEHALMIGDSIRKDILGAQEAGIRAVWLNRSGKVHDPSVVPDWEISTLEELASILEL